MTQCRYSAVQFKVVKQTEGPGTNNYKQTPHIQFLVRKRTKTTCNRRTYLEKPAEKKLLSFGAGFTSP